MSIRTQIYRSGKKLGLSPSDIDSFINRKVSDNASCINASNTSCYKAGTRYGTVALDEIYKAGNFYGTVSLYNIYKAGTMYASVSPKDF